VDLEGFQPGGRAPAPAPLDLVQDFVNTEIPDFAHDELATPAELGTWLGERGLLEPEERVGADAFVAARELRDVLRTLALLNTTGGAADDSLRARFDAALAGVVLRPELGSDATVALSPAGAGGSRALGAIAAVVVAAQASGSWRRMKACRKDGCGWLFFDASRNCSSSWCSMSICGNRTKTTAYRRRRRAGT
jgi:predicted RNA-binding Zn ribbon-like protein